MCNVNPGYDFFLIRRAGPREEAVLQMAHLFDVDDLACRLQVAQDADQSAFSRIDQRR